MKYWIITALIVCTLGLLGYGFYQGMYAAPREATMGDIQRIFYYHVPSAWTGMLCFFANFIASIWYLIVRRDPVAGPKVDAFAVATAEVGLLFCSLVLITGPLWAKPVWGIWWTWDARLTTTLVLWLIYSSYMIVRRMAHGGQVAVIAAALAIFAFLDVPIVYMSNRWWRTQHPQPVIGGGQGSGLDPQMAHVLLLNMLAFACLATIWVLVRQKIERKRQEIQQQEMERALSAIDPAASVISR